MGILKVNMKNVKMRHLRIIDEVFRTRSIKIAAGNLNITPTAVSKACIEIEDILGVPLFVRTRAGMDPTTICFSVVQSCRVIRNELDLMLNHISDYKSEVRTLRIGFQAPALEIAMMEAVSELKAENSKLNVSIIYNSRDMLLSSLSSGEFDLILVDLHGLQERADLQKKVIHSDNCFVSNKEFSYSLPHVISNWDFFRDQLWVIPVRGLALRDRFDNLLASLDLSPPHDVIEFNTRLSLEVLAQNTSGFFLVPTYALSEVQKFHHTPIITDFREELTLESGIIWTTIAHQDRWSKLLGDKICEKYAAGRESLTKMSSQTKDFEASHQV